jgi:hypothetical protein
VPETRIFTIRRSDQHGVFVSHKWLMHCNVLCVARTYICKRIYQSASLRSIFCSNFSIHSFCTYRMYVRHQAVNPRVCLSIRPSVRPSASPSNASPCGREVGRPPYRTLNCQFIFHCESHRWRLDETGLDDGVIDPLRSAGGRLRRRRRRR